MTCIEKQQGNRQGKLELLAEKIECPERETNKKGDLYCRVNDKSCPYLNKHDFVLNIMGFFYKCDYHKTFEGLDK
jgi:hypothetical protein